MNDQDFNCYPEASPEAPTRLRWADVNLDAAQTLVEGSTDVVDGKRFERSGQARPQPGRKKTKPATRP
jgi:hypothetical protein